MGTSKQRYEREIEEILRKYEEEKASGARPPKKPERPPVNGSSRQWNLPQQPSRLPRAGPSGWRRISSSQFMGAALALTLLSILAGQFLPGWLSILVTIAAITCFVLGILQYRQAGGGFYADDQKRWRGQVIDFNTRRDITNDPFIRIKRWFRRR